MRSIARALVLAIAALAAIAGEGAAQRELADREEIQVAMCGGRAGCRVRSVLGAGRAQIGPLAVVRVHAGRGCVDAPRYRDWLIVRRAGAVRVLRELARGDQPCLEWDVSRWSYRRGELSFTYGGMGAPPAADTDMRPVTVYLRPWPLAIVREVRGEDASPITHELPARGPIFHLTME